MRLAQLRQSRFSSAMAPDGPAITMATRRAPPSLIAVIAPAPHWSLSVLKGLSTTSPTLILSPMFLRALIHYRLPAHTSRPAGLDTWQPPLRDITHCSPNPMDL